jgi:hypothetical protein
MFPENSTQVIENQADSLANYPYQAGQFSLCLTGTIGPSRHRLRASGSSSESEKVYLVSACNQRLTHRNWDPLPQPWSPVTHEVIDLADLARHSACAPVAAAGAGQHCLCSWPLLY